MRFHRSLQQRTDPPPPHPPTSHPHPTRTPRPTPHLPPTPPPHTWPNPTQHTHTPTAHPTCPTPHTLLPPPPLPPSTTPLPHLPYDRSGSGQFTILNTILTERVAATHGRCIRNDTAAHALRTRTRALHTLRAPCLPSFDDAVDYSAV